MIHADAASLRVDVYQKPVSTCLNSPSSVSPIMKRMQKTEKPIVIHKYSRLKRVNMMPMHITTIASHCAGLSAKDSVIVYSIASDGVAQAGQLKFTVEAMIGR